MRKSNLVLIAAAASMLVSCGKDLILDNSQDVQAPIGFASYSERATRGDNTKKDNLEFYHNTFAVYGTKVNKKDATKFQYVFGGKPVTGTLNPAGVTCTYQATADPVLGDWKYTDPRFWDKQANYDFIAYAPVSDANPICYYYSAENALVGATGNMFKTKEDYVLQGTNLQATATDAEKVKGFTAEAGKDLDLMITAPDHRDGASHGGDVNLVFRHILSKLNVTVAKSLALQGCTVTVKDITISGLKNNGTYLESTYVNTTDSKVSGWTATKSDPYAYNLAYSTADGQILNDGTIDNSKQPTEEGYFTPGKPFFFIESLMLPQSITAADQVILTMNYTIKSGSYTEEYPYVLDLYEIAKLQNIYEGYNYTLNFTIDPDVIIFDAEATTWSEESINKSI